MKTDCEEGPPDNTLSNGEQKEKGEKTKHDASNFETFWNISNTIQGLPILIIPYAVHVGGYIGLATLVVVAFLSNYCSQILIQCLYEETHLKEKIRVRDSYIEVGQAFCSRCGGYMVLIAQVLELLFIATSYPSMCGAMLSKCFPSVSIPMALWTVISSIAFVPNIFLKNLSQVAWTSIVTVSSAKLIFLCVVSYSATQYTTWNIASLDHFEPHSYPGVLGITIACYLSQPFVPVIEASMRKREYFSLMMNCSYILMTGLNIIIGVVTDVTFHPDVEEVVTNNLPEGSFRKAVNILAGLVAFTSYSLPMFTIFEIIETSKLPVLPRRCWTSIWTKKKRILFRLGCVYLSILIAATVPHITYLFAFVGSVAGICLAFVFPAMFHMKIYFYSLKWYKILFDVLIVILGISVSLTCLIFSGISMVYSYKNSPLDAKIKLPERIKP